MLKPIAIAAALLAAPATGATVNLIANPGFETGALAPWFNGDDASNPFGPREPWNVTADDAHSDRFSAQAVDNYEIRQNFAPVAVGDVTQLSFWLRHPNEPAGSVAAVYFYYAGAAFGDVAVALTSGDGWEYFDLTSELDAGETLTGFGVYGYTGGSSDVERVRLDDVSILVAAVPEPAALALFGLGALGIAAARRRSPLVG